MEDVLRAAFDAYWEVARSTPGRQLLSYELTTWSLRSETGPSVARDLYDSFHATVEGFVDAVSRTCGVTWRVPVPLLARTVVATTTGVRLAWLVDHDEDAARAALAPPGRPARRPGPLSRPGRGREAGQRRGSGSRLRPSARLAGRAPGCASATGPTTGSPR